ncbi:MAG: DeoR/GlpR family DNA-binding transcription regulator [Chloroflexota bacterium]
MLPKELYLEERRATILKQVNQAERVSVAELSQMLGVSEVTIRADLQALADQQLLLRTHGGAVSVGNSQLALTLRRQQQIQEKSRIGEAAAALVMDGEAIVLDSSSTALAMVPHLKQRRHLTVITNSLEVAQNLRDAPGTTTVMPGGILQVESASLTGTDGLGLLARYNIQKGFFGAHGLTVAEGLTDVSPPEAEIKQHLAQRCRQVIAVLDATKWDQVGVASFAPIETVTQVVTDAPAPPELVSQIQALGIEVVEV